MTGDQKRLEELRLRYPELDRIMDISPYLVHITLMNNEDTDEIYERLEAILKEGVDEFNKKKIMNERYLYCEIPIDIDASLYDECISKGIRIPRFWRRQMSELARAKPTL